MNKRINEGYIQKVNNANKDLIHSSISFFSNNKILNKTTIDSLIGTSARRKNVKILDLFSYNTLIDEIIYEVWYTPFLSQEEKSKYLKDLSPDEKRVAIEAPGPSIKGLNILYKRINWIRVILTILAVIVTIGIVVYFISPSQLTTTTEPDLLLVALTISLSLTVIFVIMMILPLDILISDKRFKKNKENYKNKTEKKTKKV